MPNSLLWIGLVAVWLFVLVPMLINRREPIRRTGDATLATRVLHRGGMARMVRRKPGRRTDPAWLRSNARVAVDDIGDDAAADELPEPAERTEKQASPTEDVRSSEDAPSSGNSVAADAAEAEAVHADAADGDEAAADIESGGAVAPVVQAGETSGAGADSASESKTKSTSASVSVSGGTLADRMLGRTPTVVADVASTPTPPVEESEAPATKDEADRDLSETVAAEMDQPGADDPLPPPAPRRRGRGGFDPEADAEARAVRYASRQRTVVGLTVMALATLVLGLLVFSPLLWLHGVIDVLLVLYLTYLRRQVRMEQEIRRRRMARLARGRLDNAGRERRRGPVPERLRRPGAVVLEVDDEDPVFDHLEFYHPAVHHDMARASGQ
ncbi:gephyrin-like molybdotransferase receptor GlpR [Speluncibacter jeojiensis]|uniref:Transmembrane protein n=1 Tax=Speluncibacter jeojiensis TaxID=2710754 RepID=A0A9X4RDJ7_9ACTN|nr:hypothetical protein [Corynebacteriales bacterium D3-21]